MTDHPALPSPSAEQTCDDRPTALSPLESGRRFGIRDGLFQAVAQGGGEHYLSAFALLLSATPFQLSILSAIPQLLGTWAQLISVKVSHWFPSQASQVYWGILGQSVSWIPILVLPLLWPEHGPWLLIGGVAIYFTCSHFTSPAWNSFITELLDPNERGAYFARRSRVVAITSLLMLCLAGALLSLCETRDLLWIGFTICFLTAGLSRSASAFLLRTITISPHQAPRCNPTGFLDFLRTGVSHNFRHFLLFSGLMHAAVLIAGPFFVLYLIQDLHLAHWQYGTWVAAGILGQFLTLPSWGQFGDRFGNKALLTFTGLLVAFLPMLYLFSSAWLFLVTVNFFGGVVWAGLGLGLNNYVFDAVQPRDRAKAVAVSSIVNAVGWTIGTIAGSLLITAIPNRLQVGTFTLEPVSNLPLIFFLSGLLRLIVSATLLRTFHEPRQVEQRTHRRLLWELPMLKSLRQFSRRPTSSN
ncbi:MAG: MFS transporter [Nitrospira sp.]|nr:MFS transporter [Nitrospira sp.]MDH4304509.1 MFS transporter [Nitrospira sp.]MDH5192691.1 MFS transporter [Nitrospira sp.]